ncbi:MAG: hypothetical protein ACRD1K_21100 [Acidimicrobiales bacterium]
MSLEVFEPVAGNGPGGGGPPPPPEVSQAMQVATEADQRSYAPKATQLEHKARAGFGELSAFAKEHSERAKRWAEKLEDVRVAEEELDRRPRVRGKGRHRGVSMPVYVVAAVIFFLIEQAIDRSALLTLLLSRQLTHALALALPVVALACAHTAGVFLKQRDGRPGPGAMRNERNLGIASIAVGIGHALVVGAIRGLGSGLLGGALFAIIALGLFVCMTHLAMRFHDDEVADRQRTRRAAWWAERRLSETTEQMERAFAALRSAITDRISLAQVRTTAVDTALSGAAEQYHRRNPTSSYRYELPRWVCHERGLARGVLPPDLLPIDLQAWVQQHLNGGGGS